MADHAALVQQFMEMTKVNEGLAKFFLDLHHWKLEDALNGYYSGGIDHKMPEEEEEELGEEEEEEMDPMYSPTPGDESPEARTGPPRTRARSGASSRFATLNDINNDKEEDEREGERYFAGGGPHSSGQLFEASIKRKEERRREEKKFSNFIENIFQRAYRTGVASSEERNRNQSNEFRAFAGQGSKLGEDEESSERVGELLNQQSSDPIVHEITFWRQGFTVNDGDLRLYSDPANVDFLADVEKGIAPRELTKDQNNERRLNGIEIRLYDHKADDYVAIKKKPRYFSGEGQRLGSPVPNVTSNKSSETTTTAPTTALTSSTSIIALDSTQPTTQIQVRLADGSRLIGKFNHTHTVGDIRNFVRQSRPTANHFVLMTTFPSKELS
eukprot:Ihof_evm1s1013 gene=Ihof_evmTU1s1013